MYFYEIYDDTIYVSFYINYNDKGIIITSANTSFENINTKEKLSIDFINKYLDIIQYETNTQVVRAVFLKKRYFELFNKKEKNSYIALDIPYIINLHIFYDNYKKYTKLQYKIIGFTKYTLKIVTIPNEHFTNILNYEGYEIVEKSKFEERKEEIKRTKDFFEKLRRGG